MSEKRERLGSRLGFILLSAGCAIGVGNVWKFPWMVGEYGGGAFVLIYLICLVLMGVPALTIEFSLGRAAQKSPVKMFQALEKKGQVWHIHGYVSMAGNYILLMFYTVVAGWMLKYFVDTAMGKYSGVSAEAVSAGFGNMVSQPWTLIIYMAIIVILGFFVCSFTLKGGVERVTKYMMIALLIIMAVLAVNGLFQSGAKEGLAFYLKPDFSKINADVVVAAMNQAFFTLSIGMGSMAIFGSYVNRSHALLGESIRVIALDTFVAITAGLIIFPACFTYGVQPNSGPSLVFDTLPNIFNNMPGGRVWGSLFFLFMTFAAFSTVIGVFETIVSCSRDLTGWSRKKACTINCIAMLLLALPCALGFNVWSNIQPLGAGTGIMDLEDFIVSNCILPLGSMIFVLFATHKFGFGWDNFTEEANTGKGIKVKNWLRIYCAYVLPILIFSIFIIGLINYFK